MRYYRTFIRTLNGVGSVIDIHSITFGHPPTEEDLQYYDVLFANWKR